MRQSSLIGHLIEVFSIFESKPWIPADGIIRRYFHERKYLGSKDRKYIAEAYFGAIKHFIRVDELVRDATGAEELPPLFVIAAYCIAILGIPPSQFHEVLLELKLGPIDREVLFAFSDREREEKRLAALPEVDRLSVLHSAPLWFAERLHLEYPDADLNAMLSGFNQEAPIVLRANTLIVQSREALQKELAGEGFETAPSPLAPDALVMPRRLNVMGTESFKRGAFEIQDEASQLVAPMAGVLKPTMKILDACAGAGGKTLHFAQLMKNRGEIFATDVEPYKLEEMKKRVERSGAQNVRVIMPEKRSEMLGEKKEWFDVILLDVPCTGTGTLRRNPGIKWLLIPEMLSNLVAVQRQIVAEWVDNIKPGGVLLYSTCSILKEEGEEQVEWIESEFPGVFQCEGQLRTRPDLDGADAFFAARLRKRHK